MVFSTLGGMLEQQSHLIQGKSSVEDDSWQEEIKKDVWVKGHL